MSEDVDESDEVDKDRTWQLVTAVILSFATLASAWSGYQASSWGAVYSDTSRSANGFLLAATKYQGTMNRQMTSDVLVFTSWFEAEVNGDAKLADQIVSRFRPHFVPAFDAWLAGQVGPDSSLPDGSPFDLPEYVIPAQLDADEAVAKAADAVSAADAAAATSERYVLSTVLFASVLFLAGIAVKLGRRRLIHAVVGLAGLMLLGAIAALTYLPMRFL